MVGSGLICFRWRFFGEINLFVLTSIAATGFVVNMSLAFPIYLENM